MHLRIPQFLITLILFCIASTSLQGQSMKTKTIPATTVGLINGVKVAVSGVYKDGSPKQKVVDLRIDGQDKIVGVGKGKTVEFAGESWEVIRVKKPCFGKGEIQFEQKE